jgi:nucleoside-diphosphate-sugar epimerase
MKQALVRTENTGVQHAPATQFGTKNGFGNSNGSRGAAALATGISGAFNLGSGTRIAINRLVELLRSCAGVKFRTEYAPPRKGDVRHSLADISAAREKFSFEPSVSIAEGLRQYVGWVESSYRVPAAAN